MRPVIGRCGLTCSLCKAYLATQRNSDEERRRVAGDWSRVLKAEIKPEQINCDGCLSEGRLFIHCQNCEIRRCCVGKGIENCAYCNDYPCEILTKLFEGQFEGPNAKTTLDDLRSKRVGNYSS